MPETHYKARSPGRFGAQVAYLSQRCPATPLTVNTTTPIVIGAPHRRSWLEQVAVAQSTLVSDADGTVLATVKKYDASANAIVVLSSALSLEVDAQIANESAKFVLLTTLTSAQRVLDEGDVLYVDVVNNSAVIDTQPINLTFTAEILVLE